MRFDALPQWLAWQETLHFTEIDPGLDRIGQVWQQMGGTSSLPFTVVTVAGTNGKGSTVATLASILIAAGYRVGTYTSPHILRYNERICINQQPADDDTICQAFHRIDTARGDVSLTYFEYATLAAADIFCREPVDIAIFEVGMGGRLDAVNLFDADIAVITPIGLDHVQWLGDTREKIGREKAGIIRAGQSVVCSEAEVPHTVLDYADELGAMTYINQRDYQYTKQADGWSWQSQNHYYPSLPFPALKGDYQIQNSAAVVQVCDLLTERGHEVGVDAIQSGLRTISLAGRYQVIPGDVTHILDVTHNEQGAQNLAELIKQHASGKVYAILAMLADKECERVAEILSPVIDEWAFAGLDSARGQTGEALLGRVSGFVDDSISSAYADVASAHHALIAKAEKGDTILIFGSFQTVEAATLLLKL